MGTRKMRAEIRALASTSVRKLFPPPQFLGVNLDHFKVSEKNGSPVGFFWFF